MDGACILGLRWKGSVHYSFSALWVSRCGERVKGAPAAPLTIPARQRKSPLRGPFGLFPPAIGSGVILHPCRSRPLGASMRLAPACGQRLSDFQPDQAFPQPSQQFECGTGVESPLKSANRRPDDKGWTPGMAARGESRQDVELSRPQAAGREVSAVRSTDFVAGPRGLIRGPRWPPYHVHGFRNVIFCWS